MSKRKPVKPRDYYSLGGKINVALALMIVLPYLVLLYLFFKQQIDVSTTAVFFLPVLLLPILAGFLLLRRSAKQLYLLSQQTARLRSGNHHGPIQVHADREDPFGLGHVPLLDLEHREALDPRHEDHVPVLVDGGGGREAVRVQGFHEGVLPQGGKAGHVEPGGGLAVLQVVALVLHGPKGDAAQPMELQYYLLSLLRLRHIDVGLLPHAHLLPDLRMMTERWISFERCRCNLYAHTGRAQVCLQR